MSSLSRCLVATMLALVSLGDLGRAAEAPQSMDAAQIRLALEKLNVLGRVLYIAAHPDDENTRLIAYWANGASVLTRQTVRQMSRATNGRLRIFPHR